MKKDSISMRISEAEASIKGKNYARARKALIDINPDNVESPLERSRYHQTFAKYYRGIGNYRKAAEEIKEALHLSYPSNNLSLISDQKHLQGLIYMMLGKIQEAIQSFIEAYAFRITSNEAPGKICSSLSNLAYAHYVRGNLQMAEVNIKKALKYAQEYNLIDKIIKCQTNQSRIMTYQGHFTKAREILSQTEEQYSQDITEADKAFILQSIGRLNTFQLEYIEAKNNLEQSLKIFEAQKMWQEIIVSREYLGLNEYNQGNFEKAKKYYEEILKEKEITASAKAQTLRMLAEVYLIEGNLKKALKTANEAEKAIDKINELIEMGALQRVYGLIYAQKQQKDSVNYFESSISLLEELGARYELALTYLACSLSNVFSLKERNEYKTKAKSLFEEMEVPFSKLPIFNIAKRIEAGTLLSSPQVSKPKKPRISFVGLPLLAVLIGTGLLSVVYMKGTLTGFIVFLGNGILAYQTIIMMIKRNKKKKITSNVA